MLIYRTVPPKSVEYILQHISHSYCFQVVAEEPSKYLKYFSLRFVIPAHWYDNWH
jgi:hypothetical protein